jgi:hypothetical protein
MNDTSQLFLLIGVVPLTAVFAVLNFKSFTFKMSQMFNRNAKQVEYDKSKVKSYTVWVLGITVFFAVYNLILGGNSNESFQFTGVEFMVTAVGLVAVILEKKKNR